MRTNTALALVAVLLFAGGCRDTRSRYEQVRRQNISPTPEWVNRIPDRLGHVLATRHYCPDGPVWGLAKRDPESKLPYDEMGSATLVGLIRKYELYDRFGALTDQKKAEVIKFWQSWQDSKTGRFKDPRDPNRQVNEKYIVGLLGGLGTEPLYKWTTTGSAKKIETDIFLQRTKTDPDWERGGWGVGSHTGLMAVEICRAVNEGQTELIPHLEKGMEQILSHQDPASGLWGPPSAEPMRRIGGTLKVVGRFWFALGTKLPYTKELADTLIEYQTSGKWFEHGSDSCVPRNVAEVMAYCLEASDYRRDDLLAALESLAKDYTHWVLPDGTLLMHRDKPETMGLQYTTMYGLGILGGYLNWKDCRLPNPLAGRSCGSDLRYRPVLQPDNSVKVVDTQSR